MKMNELERLEAFSERYRELCRELNLVCIESDRLIELDSCGAQLLDWPDWAFIGENEYVLTNGEWICKN